jgi:hypothetical protein
VKAVVKDKPWMMMKAIGRKQYISTVLMKNLVRYLSSAFPHVSTKLQEAPDMTLQKLLSSRILTQRNREAV